MLRIVFVAVDVKTQTISDSPAQRTGGPDSPPASLLPRQKRSGSQRDALPSAVAAGGAL